MTEKEQILDGFIQKAIKETLLNEKNSHALNEIKNSDSIEKLATDLPIITISMVHDILLKTLSQIYDFDDDIPNIDRKN